MDAINLRSDTQTLPTKEMLEAIQHAPLGDDTYDEDPTVQRLEAMAAAKLRKEAALLVISGHMGNLTALMAHAKPGDEVILDAESHIFYYEAGSMASIAGLMPMLVPSHRGLLDPNELRAVIRKKNIHYPRPYLLCLENTHNRGGEEPCRWSCIKSYAAWLASMVSLSIWMVRAFSMRPSGMAFRLPTTRQKWIR